MSQITLSSNASGTGIFTIASPNSNTNRTLTLPDNTGTVLTSASSIASSQITGGVGKVLQVVNNIAAVNFSTSSTSYVDTGMSATITPTASSSNILIIVNFVGYRVNAGYLLAKLYRGATDITTAGNGYFGAGNDNNSGYDSASVNFTLLDSPATTSATTYKVYGRYDGGGTNSLFGPAGNSSATGQYPNYSITLMEIAA